MKRLLGILGRGIQQSAEGRGDWTPTDDLIVTDEHFGTLAVRVPFNDDDPHAIVGGGELNILAVVALWEITQHDLVACEFGNRSKYLTDVGGPMGSKIVGEMFAKLAEARTGERPNVEVFDESRWNVRYSNPWQELYNMFSLARANEIMDVDLVAVDAHTRRVTAMALKHIFAEPKFAGMNFQCYSSEMVLWEADPARYESRVRRIFDSKAYLRTLLLEQNGTNALHRGVYPDISSAAAAAAT